MAAKAKIVFRPNDVPLIESPDGTMRDSVMVTDESCGAQQYTAGLFFVRPGTRGHADSHAGLEELYYIFAGRGTVVIDDEPHEIQAGDVVFIPSGATHYLKNDHAETLGLFWAMAAKWSNMTAIQHELARWQVVDSASGWTQSAAV